MNKPERNQTAENIGMSTVTVFGVVVVGIISNQILVALELLLNILSK